MAVAAGPAAAPRGRPGRTTHKETPMGIWDALRGELIDIIEWNEQDPDQMVWRFPRYENEIKNGAKLIVRESQVAAFVNEGVLAWTASTTRATSSADQGGMAGSLPSR